MRIQSPFSFFRACSVVFGFLGLLAVAVGWFFFRSASLETILNSAVVQQGARAILPSAYDEAIKVLPDMLGMHGPKTYLLLFQNNTELRPGGGFIGVYAVVRMDQGRPTILVVEGTELLDRKAPADNLVVPPAPITAHLKVDRWYFRDSNWSPDFSESAKQALALYQAEHGIASDSIDAVIGITPTVLEKLMVITGPFTIQGITFAADTVTERLEHEVEYGYSDRGIAFRDRKQIIAPFMSALIDHLRQTAPTHVREYVELLGSLIAQKHIVAYSADEPLAKAITAAGADGRVVSTSADYVLWVDANLAALKTDHAMVRTLSYQFEAQPDGSIVATTTMRYRNTGVFDWRTSRYRTYARLYVPEGAVLIRSSGALMRDRDETLGLVDTGVELGKTWFGAFTSIEPGKERSLSFTYRLPPRIAEEVARGTYHLLVQKQIGVTQTALTLALNFGTTVEVSGVTSTRSVERQSGSTATISTILDTDIPIEITLKRR